MAVTALTHEGEAVAERTGMWAALLTDVGPKPLPKKSPPPLTPGWVLFSVRLLPAISWLGWAAGSQASAWPAHVTFQTDSVH